MRSAADIFAFPQPIAMLNSRRVVYSSALLDCSQMYSPKGGVNGLIYGLHIGQADRGLAAFAFFLRNEDITMRRTLNAQLQSVASQSSRKRVSNRKCAFRLSRRNYKRALASRPSSFVSLSPAILHGAILVACFVSAGAISAFGQRNISPTSAGPPAPSAPYVPTLTYDVTSVRQCPPGPQSNGWVNPLHSGRLSGTCNWAEQLIGWAYGVDYRVQVVGGPDWVKTARSNEVRFSVEARSDSATDDKLAKLSDDQATLEKEHMLQTLLADRFGLRAHMETRQEPALALTIAKNGLKMQKGEPPPPRPAGKTGPWPAAIESDRDPRGTSVVAHGASIGGESNAAMAGWLQFYLGKRVVDLTGLTGTYNFTLQFHGTLSDMQTDNGSAWPPIETAIQQLGLELRDTKVPLQVVVIDHIEQPSPN